MTSIGDIRKALVAERKRIDKALAALGEAPGAPRKRKARTASLGHIAREIERFSATGSTQEPVKRKRGRPKKDAAASLTSAQG